MAVLKRKGDLAELAVATDLVRQGHRVAFPFGEDCDCDVLVDRGGGYERVQVKYVTPDGDALVVRARSLSLTAGRVIAVKRYTAALIDWLAAYDASTGRCYYVPAEELGAGQSTLTLRLAPARNGQRSGIRIAKEYEQLPSLT